MPEEHTGEANWEGEWEYRIHSIVTLIVMKPEELHPLSELGNKVIG